MGSFYDVLGLFAPLTLRAKFIFQEAQLSGLPWNDKLPRSLFMQWQSIQNNLLKAVQIMFPHFAVDQTTDTQIVDLHVFADASAKVYAAVAYLAITDTASQQTRIKFCNARSQIVKPKLLSIPHLELVAALMAAKLVSFLRTELHITFCNSYVWSDSFDVLCCTEKNLFGKNY